MQVSTALLAILAGFLAYAGGSTFNDVFDSAFDAKHRPDRAIPSGVIPRSGAILIGSVELALGLGLFVVLGASPLMAAGLLVMILSYDWLHKRWAGSVLLMAGCRLFLALTVATLPGAGFTPHFLGWAVAVYIYIVLLSVMARAEYRRPVAGEPVAGEPVAGGPVASGRHAGEPEGHRSTGHRPQATGYRPQGFRIGRLLMFIPMLDAFALLYATAWVPAVLCALAIPLGAWAQKRAAAT